MYTVVVQVSLLLRFLPQAPTSILRHGVDRCELIYLALYFYFRPWSQDLMYVLRGNFHEIKCLGSAVQFGSLMKIKQ
jgi:hypothetical protein